MANLSWLWPDRVIGKRESRRLREEHNALVNRYVSATNLLRSISDQPEAMSFRSDTIRAMQDCLTEAGLTK